MKQLNKFLLLGVFSTLIDYSIYSLLIFFGLDYIIAIVLGYSMGLWSNFVLGRRYIFINGVKVKNVHREFFYVVLIAMGGLLINILVVHFITYSLNYLELLYSRIIAIMVAFLWNYIMRKIFIVLNTLVKTMHFQCKALASTNVLKVKIGNEKWKPHNKPIASTYRMGNKIQI